MDGLFIGFDRNSIKTVDQKLAYVAATRGKINIQLVVENKEDFKSIQNRTGDRTSAIELVERKRAQRSAIKEKVNEAILKNNLLKEELTNQHTTCVQPIRRGIENRNLSRGIGI